MTCGWCSASCGTLHKPIPSPGGRLLDQAVFPSPLVIISCLLAHSWPPLQPPLLATAVCMGVLAAPLLPIWVWQLGLSFDVEFLCEAYICSYLRGCFSRGLITFIHWDCRAYSCCRELDKRGACKRNQRRAFPASATCECAFKCTHQEYLHMYASLWLLGQG